LNSSESNSTSPQRISKHSFRELDHCSTRQRQRCPRSGPLDSPPRLPKLRPGMTAINDLGREAHLKCCIDVEHKTKFFFKKKV
jgi:hypothetical protein